MRDGRMFSESANEAETAITLAVLNAVHENDKVTQRSLAQEVGVALGLTNAYLKRCVKKGLVKVKEIPARRYAYYLTPEGFREKCRLTAEYLSTSLDFFRRARSEYADAFAHCSARGWTRVALYGSGELAEIATLAARNEDVELVAVINPGRNTGEFHGVPVVQSATNLDADAVIIACAETPQNAFDTTVQSGHPTERVLTPALLRVSRNGHQTGADE